MGEIAEAAQGNRGMWIRISGVGIPVTALVTVAGLTVPALWTIFRPWEISYQWPSLSALLILTAIAQIQAIDIYGRGKISTGAAVVMAGTVLFGIQGALILAPIVSITQWVLKRGLWYRSIFDLGTVTLSAAAFTITYSAIADRMPNHEPLLLIIPAVVGAGAFYIVNIALLAIAMGLSEDCSPLVIWRERFRWLLVYYLVYGAFALALALAYQAIGMSGLFAFMVPLVLTRYVMKQYIDRTEENVSQLELVNQDLRLANDEVHRTLAELRFTYDATIMALSAALDSRDSETEGHSQRVAGYAVAIAREMGMNAEDRAVTANGALLHDVGKIGIPDAILRKKGPLDDAEWQTMRTHPQKGYHMLCHIDFLKDALPIVLYHHERYDGKGYPTGLKGADVPLGAQIFAVADTLDAITSKRPYREAGTYEVARDEIVKCSGAQFDPRVVEAFLRVNPTDFTSIFADGSKAGSAVAKP